MTLGEMGVRQSGTMALFSRAAAKEGFGLGEAQAGLKTMQSALQLCMPMVYGRAAHSMGHRGPAGPLGTPSRAPGVLYGDRERGIGNALALAPGPLHRL
jgi:hypothetical protein